MTSTFQFFLHPPSACRAPRPRIANEGCPLRRPSWRLRDPLPLLKHVRNPAGTQARCSFRPMPSRQERRKAERDAAKRAPAQAGSAGAGGAAAALANLNVNVNPGGDWTTQAADSNLLFRALGAEIVKQRAGEGDREAQWSLGRLLVKAADRAARTPVGTASKSPKVEEGLAEEGLALLEKAAGHASYSTSGQDSPCEEGARASRGVVHQGRRGRVAECYVRTRVHARQGGGRGGAELPGGGGLIQARGRRW